MTIRAMIIFLFFFLSNLIHGTEYTKFNFNNLADLDKQDQLSVEMRGFIYSAEDGRKIFSPTPNLKTCCVGSQAKIADQIVIGSYHVLPDTTKAITLRGNLSVVPTYNEKKQLISLYRIDHVNTVENTTDLSLVIGVIIVAVLFSLIYWLYSRKSQYRHERQQ